MNYYNIWLPVFKQGDDLLHFLNKEGSNGKQAFLELSLQYKNAAEICIKISECIGKSKKEIIIDADAHHIGVQALKSSVLILLDQNIITEENSED